MGEFVADKTDGGFIKGTQWLVWKFESDSTLSDAVQVRCMHLACFPVVAELLAEYVVRQPSYVLSTWKQGFMHSCA